MSTRSFVLLSFVAAAFTFAPSARADVASPSSSSTGPAGTSSGSTSGTGGSGAVTCTIDTQQVAGRVCQTCNPNSTCGSLDSSFNYACTQSSSVQVWCNGPNENSPSDSNEGGCTVKAPAANGEWAGAALSGAIALAAAVFLRRRRG